MAKEKNRFFATPNERRLAYQKCPKLLAEDLLMIFGVIKDEHDVGVHNHMVAKVIEFCPDVEGLLLNVAKTIIRTAKNKET
ncbi:MAG: hypothetical protein GWN13_13020 [Phycisphaerae bacterium]|nr:hypothetical protein [Phycisphaerae bacterium]